MLSNINADDVQLEMSLPNRAGILTPVDGLDEGEYVTNASDACDAEQLKADYFIKKSI